ncbi:MAG: LytTR family transcriptional regulator DNA-binding domain-containing protein [Bacteroidota bacterium]
MKKKKLLSQNKKKSPLHAGVKAEKEVKKPVLKKVQLHSKKGTAHIDVDKIMMAVAEDHKVKVYVNSLTPEWYERNESLEKFFSILPQDKFEKLNKFYIINLDYMPFYFNKEKTITFNNGLALKLKHKIKLSAFGDKT